MTKPVLNIIGTGKLGTVMGRLLADSQQLRIGSLFSRNLAKAQAAQQFIGQGTAIDRLACAQPAAIWLIATSDDAIGNIASELTAQDLNWQNTTVFHCSGIHSSVLLAPLANLGAATASLHPTHSFADPQASLKNFPGTCCTLEGEQQAIDYLEILFSPLDAKMVRIDPQSKPLYHAATAVASNHLVALLNSSINMLTTAGMEEETARELLAPLANKTCANLFSQGADQALTGPISRGDSGTVDQHLKALQASLPDLLPSYRALATLTLEIATATRQTPGHRAIAELLQSSTL